MVAEKRYVLRSRGITFKMSSITFSKSMLRSLSASSKTLASDKNKPNQQFCFKLYDRQLLKQYMYDNMTNRQYYKEKQTNESKIMCRFMISEFFIASTNILHMLFPHLSHRPMFHGTQFYVAVQNIVHSHTLHRTCSRQQGSLFQ